MDLGLVTRQLSRPAEVQKVFDYVDEHSVEFIEDLRAVVRQPSISAQNKGIMECAQLLQKMMVQAGMSARIISTVGHPIVFGELKSPGSKRTILFAGHYDVQPPEPIEEWRSEPFAADMRDGKMYGRGVSDMKVGIMSLVKAVESYLKVHGQVPVNLKFLFEGEEEIGSVNLEQIVKANKEMLAADGLVWYEGISNQVALGRKGMLYVELRVEEERPDFHSREAALLVSPIWRLVWALNTMKDPSGRITIGGFYDDVKAPTEQEQVLLKELSFDQEKLYGKARLLYDPATKEKLVRERLYSPTCNICGIVSGYTGAGAKTVIPKSASVKIDFRLPANQDPDDIFEKLKLHLSKEGFSDIKVNRLGSMWPFGASPDEDIARAVIVAAKMTYDQKVEVLPRMPSSNPCYVFQKHLKAPFVSTGASTSMSSHHAPNEYVDLKDYVNGIKKAAAIIHSYGSQTA